MESFHDLYDEDVERSDTCQWEHPSGRNGQHKNPAQFAHWEQVATAEREKLAAIKAKPYVGSSKDKQEAKRKRKHAQKKKHERGVAHGIVAKGSYQQRR